LAGPGTIKLKPAPWVKMPPYQWHAVDPETGESQASARERDELKLRQGEYQIVWRQSEHYCMDVPLPTMVALPPGKTVEVPIDTGIEIIVPKGIQPPEYWWLTASGETEPLSSFQDMLGPQVVPAGSYRLGWQDDEHYAPSVDLGLVTIEPGSLNQHVVDFGFQLVLADWVPKKPYSIVLKAADGTELGSWYKFDTPLMAPPARYQVSYRQSEHCHSPISLGEVTVPDHGFAKITIDSGVNFKTQSESKPPYQAIFVPLDSGKGNRLVREGAG
jgi:Ca-activated chloride channel family protein